MNPKLVALHGPLKGSVLELIEGEFTIGRDRTSRVCIRDQFVSRNHAILRHDSARIEIVDLNSQNGTFVNGVPIRERLLETGDQIRIGHSVFALVAEAEDPVRHPDNVQLDSGRLTTRSQVRLRQEDSPYLNPAMSLTAPGLTERVANDLKTLLSICTEINGIRDPNELQRKLLESILEVIPADLGAVLLLKEGSSDEFVSSTGWSRQAGEFQTIQVSQTVVQAVVKDGTSLLSNDVCEGGEPGSENLTGCHVQSVLAVPILAFNRLLGVVYLESLNRSGRFDSGHLQFMAGVAAVAGIALENARHLESLQTENRMLKADLNLQHSMVGESAPMRELYQFIAKVALTDSTVLLRGESGTGKEVAARAIHLNSPRAQKPFVAVNCAALTETLLESELFGHEKGAFTGAIAQKKGKLEVAEGGTIFLDEIGELAPALQAKLLRVLQEREFERVGGTRPVNVNIRLIAATNRGLEQAIKEGRFRQDLYFRLNVVSLTIPPLRKRREDIPLLASYFTSEFAKKMGRRIEGISTEARKCLTRYDWPGNVRELQNAIERAIVLGTTQLIMPEDLPESLLGKQSLPGAAVTDYHQAMKETKKQLVLQVIEQVGGDFKEAAELLGIHPNNLHRMIRQLNLKGELKKKSSRNGKMGT